MPGTSADVAALRIESAPQTLRELALVRVRRAIVAGIFEPEARLVERTLCEQLGVSRSVVREVIRHLEAEGLVTMAKQGPVVAGIDWDAARQIYEIRALLESAAVGACAKVADAPTISALEVALDDLDAAVARGDALAVLDATIEFYRVIFTSSGHHLAWEVVTRLNSRISRLRVMTLATENRTVSGPARLRSIFEAIERNDSRAASKRCREHIAEAARLAERMLVPGARPGPGHGPLR